MRTIIILITLHFYFYTAWSQPNDIRDSIASSPIINTSYNVDKHHLSQTNIDSLQMVLAGSSSLKWYTMFERIPGDWVSSWNLTVRKDNIPTMLAITALTTVAIATDRPMWENSKKFYKSSRTVKDASDFFVYLGDGKPQFGLSAAFALYGFVAKDDRALLTGSQITEAVLACGSVVQVLKHITGRESPLVSTTRNGRWQFFPNQITYHKRVPHYDAFPSGHIATSLATLIVVLENYPETKPWLRPIGYTIVGCIGVGLMNRGIHWWSDFPLGLYLGYQFGMIAAHPGGLPGDGNIDESSTKISFGPSITPTGTGVSVAYHF